MSLKGGFTPILKKKSKVPEFLKKIYNKIFPFFGCIEELLEVVKDCFFSDALWSKMNIISLFIRAITIARYKRKSLKKISFSKADWTVFLKLILLYYIELCLIPNLIASRFSQTETLDSLYLKVIVFIFRIVIMAGTFLMAGNNIKSGLLILILFSSFLFFEPYNSINPTYLYFSNMMQVVAPVWSMRSMPLNYNHDLSTIKEPPVANHKQFIILYLVLFLTLMGYIDFFRSTNQYETKSEYELNNQDLLKYEVMEFIIGGVLLVYPVIPIIYPLLIPEDGKAANYRSANAGEEGSLQEGSDKNYIRCGSESSQISLQAISATVIHRSDGHLATRDSQELQVNTRKNRYCLIIAGFCIFFSIIELAKTDMLLISKEEGTGVEKIGFCCFAFIIVIVRHFLLQDAISCRRSETDSVYRSLSHYVKNQPESLITIHTIYNRFDSEFTKNLFLTRCSHFILCCILASPILEKIRNKGLSILNKIKINYKKKKIMKKSLI